MKEDFRIECDSLRNKLYDLQCELLDRDYCIALFDEFIEQNNLFDEVCKFYAKNEVKIEDRVIDDDASKILDWIQNELNQRWS